MSRQKRRWIGLEIGVLGISSGTSAADNYGVLGFSNGVGVYGFSTLDFGVLGVSNDQIGAVGASTLSHGVLGEAAANNAFGTYGANTNAAGTGVFGVGNNALGTYFVTGTGGAFTGEDGVLAAANTAAGTGVIANGQNNGSWQSLITGSGGAFSSTTMGVFGYANSTADDTWGGYFTNDNAFSYAYVGGTFGFTDYKILGGGTVSTIVTDLDGNNRNMFCPESPEVLFQDFGTGKLVNGEAVILLDEIFSKNIHVDQSHPLRVFVQLEGECNGVYVYDASHVYYDDVYGDFSKQQLKFGSTFR